MKRISVLLSLCICLGLLGCNQKATKEPETSNGQETLSAEMTEGLMTEKNSAVDYTVTTQYDHDRATCHPQTRCAMTEDTVYFLTSMYHTGTSCSLCYYDKRTGSSGPLCGKAECLHNNADCDAYIGNNFAGQGLSYYDGKLYILRESESSSNCFQILSVNTDGTGRKEIREVELPAYMSGSLDDRYVQFHRGYMFFSGTSYQVEDGIQYNITYLYAYPLESDERITLYEQKWQSGAAYYSIVPQPVGNQAYYMISQRETGDDGTESYLMDIRKWNLNTKAEETVYSGGVDAMPYQYWVDEEEILVSGYVCGKIYSLKNGSAELTEKFGYDSLFIADFCDGWVVHYNNADEPVLNRTHLEIDRFDGEIIYREELPEYMEYPETGMFLTSTLCGLDEKNAYFYCFKREETYSEEHLIVHPLNGDEAIIVWSNCSSVKI